MWTPFRSGSSGKRALAANRRLRQAAQCRGLETCAQAVPESGVSASSITSSATKIGK
jgi:hypothetical protein